MHIPLYIYIETDIDRHIYPIAIYIYIYMEPSDTRMGPVPLTNDSCRYIMISWHISEAIGYNIADLDSKLPCYMIHPGT